MKRMIVNMIAACTLFFISACNESKTLSVNDYVNYVQSNEKQLSNSITVNGLTITTQYVPPVLMALSEAGNIEALKENYSSLVSNYTDADYFELSLTCPSQNTRKYLRSDFQSDTSESAFDEYLDFGIQEDIRLVIETDTFACMYMHREISDAITNTMKYTLGFDSHDGADVSESGRTILLNSQQFQLQHIVLRISADQISSLPSVKL